MAREKEERELGQALTAIIIVIALSALAFGILNFLGEGILFEEELGTGELPSREDTVNRTFRIGLEGELLRYRETYSWSERQFWDIRSDMEEFRGRELRNFEEIYGMEPEVYGFSFVRTDLSTHFESEVRGKVTRDENIYTADLNWFLNAYGLDLIENQFKETETELTWYGEIDGIPTEIVIDLPMREVEYSEGGEPAGYSYNEIWWPERPYN